MPAPTELQTSVEPVDSLVEYPGNPRRGDVETIAASLTRNGQFRPIVAQRSTRHVLAGNHTLRAARDVLGWDRIAVVWVDADDDAAKRIVLADNRTAELATNSDAALAELLQSLDDLEGTGYDAEDLGDLLAGMEAPDLEDLFGEHGHPTDEDTLVKITVRVQPDVAALWRTAGDTTGLVDEVARDTALVRAAYTQLVGDPGGHNTAEHGQ